MKNYPIVAFALLIVSASAAFAQMGGVVNPGQGGRPDQGVVGVAGDVLAQQNATTTRSTGWKMGLNESLTVNNSSANITCTLTLTSNSLVLQKGQVSLMDDTQSTREVWSVQFSGTAKVMDFQSDGNLVVYSTDNKVLWSSDTSGGKNSKLVLRETGTLEIDMGSGRWWKK